MNMKINHIKWLTGSLMTAALAAGISSCSDDHFDLSSAAQGKATLWENIQTKSELSEYADILQSVYYSQNEEKTTPETYADLLNGDQTFTVWAPVNGSFNYAYYKGLLQTGVRDSIYKVEKELIRNNMTRYSNAINSSGTKSIALFNSKTVELDYDAQTIKGVNITTPNIGATNGVLHITSAPVAYQPNLYEFMATRSDLDSINTFIKGFQTTVFNRSASTQGPTVDGKITWVDSIVSISNDYTSYYLGAYINREDSNYAMIMPTNDTWKAMLEKTQKYFTYKPLYEQDVYTQTEAGVDTILKGKQTTFTQAEIDSLVNLYSKNAICEHLAFNANWQYEQIPITTINEIGQADSLVSTSGIKFKKTGTLNKTNRRNTVEIDDFRTMFGNADPIEVSNGYAYLTNDFSYPIQTYAPDIDELNYQSCDATCYPSFAVVTYNNPKVVIDGDTIQTDSTFRYTNFIMSGINSTQQPAAYFKATNVLSCKYDIYVVVGYNTDNNMRNKFQVFLSYDTPDKRIAITDSRNARLKNPVEDAIGANGETLYNTEYFVNRGIHYNDKGEVDYTDTICVAKDFEFPICYYGISSNAYPVFKIESKYSSRERSIYCNEIWINSIILKAKEW